MDIADIIHTDSTGRNQMKKLAGKVPLVVGFWLATHGVAHALDVVPTTTADGIGNGSLRDAVRAVNSDFSDFGPDSITLGAGTYTLTLPGRGESNAAYGDLNITHSAFYGTLTIQGVGAGATIIDATALGDRVFNINNSTVVFKNLTIRGGTADLAGGGIYCYGSTVTLDDVILENNSAVGTTGVNGADGYGSTTGYGGNGATALGGGSAGGGAICTNFGTLSITNSTIRNNVARGGNGGIGGNGGYGYLGGTGGQGGYGGAAFGGGIYAIGTTVTITASTLNGNSAVSGNGGKGGAGGDHRATINTSYGGTGGTGGSSQVVEGGGICSTGSLTIINSTVSSNQVTPGTPGNGGNGGGPGTSGTITRGGNGGTGGSGYFLNTGGGIRAFQVTIRNSTIAGNSVANTTGGTGGAAGGSGSTAGTAGANGPTQLGYGGGVFTNTGLIPPIFSVGSRAALPVLESTIVGDNTAGVGPDFSGTVMSTNSLVENPANTTFFTGSANNITGQDAGLQPLANNGGPTFTQNLSATSPAIGTGSNSTNLTLDQRGTGFPRVVGAAADIGAIEFNAPPVIVSTAFTPAAPTPGATVTFTVVATDPEGGPVTLSYNYGDGVTDATGIHAFAASGTFNVVVTATDNAGQSTQATIVVTVGTTSDTDGDNFDDEIEIALLTNQNATSSRPFNLDIPANATGLNIKNLSIKLNFSKTNKDVMTLRGSLPDALNVLGKIVIVDVGGVVRAFALDTKGFSPQYQKDSFFRMLGLRDGKSTEFQMTLVNGSFQALLADEKLTNTAVRNLKTTVPLIFIVDNKKFVLQLPVTYSKQGKSGKANTSK